MEAVIIKHKKDKIEKAVLAILLSDIEVLILGTINPFKKMRLRNLKQEIKQYQTDKSIGIEERSLSEILNGRVNDLFWNLIILDKTTLYRDYHVRLLTQVGNRYDILLDFVSEKDN